MQVYRKMWVQDVKKPQTSYSEIAYQMLIMRKLNKPQQKNELITLGKL